MDKAIVLILVFVVLFLVTRCDQRQAIRRSQTTIAPHQLSKEGSS